MAVQIRGYRQQTGTPTGLVSGGNLQNNVDPGIGGGLMDLAAGAGALLVRRQEEKEGIASAWAGDELAKFQSEVPRQADVFRQESGEAAEGYVDKLNGWTSTRIEEILAAAPTEKSREYLRGRLTDFRTRIDLQAYEYQQTAQNGWVLSKVDSGTESAAAAAAANPGLAPTVIAESRAAIEANPVLRPEQKREKIEALVQSVSYADVLGELERDPYKARNYLRARIGIGEAATAGEAAIQMESAVNMLEEVEQLEGFKVPGDQRQEVIANLMAGGTIGFKDGEMVVSRKGGETAQVPLTYGALAVPKVIELLSRADSEIARRENEVKQQAQAGKVTFAQMWQDTNVALANGDPVQLPPRSEALVFYSEQEVDIMYRQAEVAQAMAGQLKAMEGQPSGELSAIVMSDPPVGAENREATQRAYDMRRQRAAQVLAAREADPGAYVLNTSASVQTANTAYSEAAQKAAGGDASAVEQMPLLLRNYISVSMGEQARLGIAKPALPKQFVETIVTDFNTNIRDNPQGAAANLQFLAAMLDGMPDTRNAIAEKVGTIGQFAMEGVAPQVVKKLWEANQVKEAAVKENLPSGVVWANVTSSVQNAFAPMAATFGTNLADSNRYIQSGQKLAANYLATGVYTSAKDAANAAYAELFSDYNDIADSGTYRIPRGQGYDSAAVQVGLAQYVTNLTGEELFVEDSGRPLEEARMAKARTVRNKAFWRNNADDSGAILYAPGGVVVKGADGKPIEVSFSEAQMLKPPVINREIPSPYSGLR